jgi:glycosyltransferase involved in cell wall biosynthesis
MKILMLTPYLPFPPFSGGQVRSYHLIKNLSLKHQIFLVSLVKSDEEKKFVKELEKFCARVLVFRRPKRPWHLKRILRTGFSLFPFLVIRNLSPSAKKAIKELVEKENFDLIHAETFYVMPHLPPTKIPVLLVEQTIEYRVYAHFIKTLSKALFFLKPLLYLDVQKLKWWEKFYWKKADLVVAVSGLDQTKIKSLAPEIEVQVVSNGVDCQFFEKRVCSRNPRPTILFVGNFKWLQNKEAAAILIKEVWPLVKKEIKKARLLIIGRHAREFVRSNDPQIEVKTVDDIRQAYQAGWVFIAPFKSGGGSRLKIFEAMASGLPIVATSKGVEGIKAKAGHHFLLGEKKEDLAKNVFRLIKNKRLSQKIGQAAKKMVRETYDWRFPAKELDQVYRKLVK